MSTITNVKNIFQTYLSSSTEPAFEKLSIISYSFDRKYFYKIFGYIFPLRILRESIAIEHSLYSIVHVTSMLKLSDSSKTNRGLSSLSVISSNKKSTQSRLTKLEAVQDVYKAWEEHKFTSMYI
jgi:hypothetical protein